MHHTNKPIDETFIDFLRTPSSVDTMRYKSFTYAHYKQMSIVEIKELFWNAKEVLNDLPALDVAFERVYREVDEVRQYINLRYLHQTETYKENNFALYYPLMSRNLGNTPTVLKELLETYSKDVFSYIPYKDELIVIPHAHHRRSSIFLEFMEMAKLLKISDGPSVTDSLVWKP